MEIFVHVPFCMPYCVEKCADMFIDMDLVDVVRSFFKAYKCFTYILINFSRYCLLALIEVVTLLGS